MAGTAPPGLLQEGPVPAAAGELHGDGEDPSQARTGVLPRSWGDLVGLGCAWRAATGALCNPSQHCHRPEKICGTSEREQDFCAALTG